MLSSKIIKEACWETFFKFSIFYQIKNPVMFSVFIGACLTTIFSFQNYYINNSRDLLGPIVSLWLWLTLYFAYFAEAVAEGKSKAQAQSLRKSRQNVMAKKLMSHNMDAKYNVIDSRLLKVGDLVLVEKGELIPGDGEVVQGIASVNESAITGESAPVIRESGGDRSAVTGGTLLLSDWLIIKITAKPGETFIDTMITLVEGAKRKKTPAELALSILLAALSFVFLTICISLYPLSFYSSHFSTIAKPLDLVVIVALFVCLAPTTIGALLSAIGIAGMNRMLKSNILAMSGRAVETAGDIDILLLDKTGTITFGDRQAMAFYPLTNIAYTDLVKFAYLSSIGDETAEGRSISKLAEQCNPVGLLEFSRDDVVVIPFSAHTRLSGINNIKLQIRKGAPESIQNFVQENGAIFPEETFKLVHRISAQGATALVVATQQQVYGVIELKDKIKPNIKERFAQLRTMGIRTIMITGDHHLTAASISAEAGVDDFLAQANPEDKLKLIRKLQQEGHLVAMTGDGTNDAPALAQADVAIAMNTGTQAAKEAANLIDLDSDPTKIMYVVEIGKQLLMTRGALTAFSIANDIAKYFALLPAAFSLTYPGLEKFNLMHLSSNHSAVLSTVIFNALIILFLIPLALKGVKYLPCSAEDLLKRHMLIYGLGGLVVPFIGIKCIDLILSYTVVFI